MLTYRGNRFSGGQGVYIRNLSRELHEIGHEVTVLSGPPYPDVDEGVRLVRLRGLDLYARLGERLNPFHEVKHPIDLYEYLGVFGGFFPEPLTFGMRAVRHLQRSNGFDIVHDNQSLSYPLLALPRMGMPVVASVHHPIHVDRDMQLAATPTWRERWRLRRWYSFLGMQSLVSRRMPMLITPSDNSRRDVGRTHRVPLERIRRVYIGVDSERFRRPSGIESRPHRVVVVTSADTALKGLSDFWGAIQRIAAARPIEVQVVGSPRDPEATAADLRRRGIADRVEFLGKVELWRLVEAYSSATVVVMPSHYEGFGLPAVEAMACEVPVVAYDTSSLPEVIGTDGVAGRLAPLGDQEALAREICRYLDDPEAAARAGRAGRERVLEHFNWRKTAHETAALYEEALGGEPPAC
ncbi:MAG: glycosyltransferase family 4 protein [Dehalococcoidia bacterium]|jgi:glycosyltransferase involved in cell wall biosynthesis|nr:glycosyltransferase family 4 protein [Dehalococcoidia bacterium]